MAIADLKGGPGWVIRASDLRPAITDVEAFRIGMAGDQLAEPIEALWSGDPVTALEILGRQYPSRRVRALQADCYRDLGDFDKAITMYDDLVAACVGTAQEATMLQHRAKVHFAAGHVTLAIEGFHQALSLRIDGDPTLLASSRFALEVCENALKHPVQAPPRVPRLAT